MKFDFFVFDLDGTLFDTRQDIIQAVNLARAEFNLVPLDPPHIVAMVGDGMGTLGAKVFKDSEISGVVGAQTILKHYRLFPTEKTIPYPGALELLNQIKAPKAILSNKPVELIHPILKKWGCEKFFVEVFGGDSFPERKPNPIGINFLIQKYQLKADRMLMIGDHHPDLEVARVTGMKSVFCRFGFSGKSELPSDYTIDHFDELLPLLGEAN